MTGKIDIIDTHGSFRLIRDTDSGRHAIIEERDGKVYTLHPRDRSGQPDTQEGMATLVEPDGWLDPAEAQIKFDEVTREGDDLAKEIW